MTKAIYLSAILLVLLQSAWAQPPSSPAEGGAQMGTYRNKGLDRAEIKDAAVLGAMSRVARHKFVPPELAGRAYEDRALPIGSGQTISQPFIVALMTQSAKIKAGDKVLEVGTGSGYQSAVIAELGAKVFSVEIVPELSAKAGEVLKELGYADRVSLRVGDGWAGWPEEAPFDAILVTAAAPRAPEALLAQLKDKGRLVIPVEDKSGEGEHLLVLERDGADFVTKSLGAVRFVPMTGEARKESRE